MANRAQKRMRRKARSALRREEARVAFEELDGLKAPEQNGHDILPNVALSSAIDSVQKEVKVHGALLEFQADIMADWTGRLTRPEVLREIAQDPSYTYEEVQKVVWSDVSEEFRPHRGGVERG